MLKRDRERHDGAGCSVVINPEKIGSFNCRIFGPHNRVVDEYASVEI